MANEQLGILLMGLAAVLILIGLVAGCATKPPDAIAGETTVHRVVFPEDGVICYVSDGMYSGGIACLEVQP